ncbi:unnamed protein product, partial [Mycena citricolor]
RHNIIYFPPRSENDFPYDIIFPCEQSRRSCHDHCGGLPLCCSEREAALERFQVLEMLNSYHFYSPV